MPSNGAVEEIRTPAPQIRSLVLKSQFFSLNAAISRGRRMPPPGGGGPSRDPQHPRHHCETRRRSCKGSLTSRASSMAADTVHRRSVGASAPLHRAMSTATTLRAKPTTMPTRLRRQSTWKDASILNERVSDHYWAIEHPLLKNPWDPDVTFAPITDLKIPIVILRPTERRCD